MTAQQRGEAFRPKPTKQDFEYKVIEKKRADGTVYYIGESTLTGRLQILTENKYRKNKYEDDRMRALMCGSIGGRMTKYVPMYELMDACESISRVVKHAQFVDPCLVKEIICKIRRDNKAKVENLKHSKVVSIGECPCK
jgi:hypothetical protein